MQNLSNSVNSKLDCENWQISRVCQTVLPSWVPKEIMFRSFEILPPLTTHSVKYIQIIIKFLLIIHGSRLGDWRSKEIFTNLSRFGVCVRCLMSGELRMISPFVSDQVPVCTSSARPVISSTSRLKFVRRACRSNEIWPINICHWEKYVSVSLRTYDKFI